MIVILGLLLVLVIVLLYKVIKMGKQMKELCSPWDGSNKSIENLPYEFSRLRSQLAPAFYLPLQEPAYELQYLEEMVEEDCQKKEKFYFKKLLSEMENFAKRGGSPKEPFPASEDLKRYLKGWSSAANKRWLVGKWKEEYSQVFLEVLLGKKDINQGKAILWGEWILCSKYNEYSLERDNKEPEISIVYNSLAEHWQAGKWYEWLERERQSIREIKTNQ